MRGALMSRGALRLGGSRAVVLGLPLLMLWAASVQAACPNMCSGHGDCNPQNKCTCWVANRAQSTYWTGGDCSIREWAVNPREGSVDRP